ncbi:hypothetical protein VI817_006095 [Penicillium citrinum]|nr:hypothetical protein VI817_006095 [Penicillium citrinum]
MKSNIQNNFAVTGSIPINSEKIFSKFNILFQISISPNSLSNSRSDKISPKTPKHSPTSSKIALDQIIEEYTLVLYSTALLAQDNANLCTPNKKKYQKYTQSNRYIAHKEDLQLAQQQNQPVENNRLVALAQCELSIQHNKPAMRTLSSNDILVEIS